MPSTYPLESDSARGWERRMTKVMFAVIKSGGRQYKVSVGQTLEVNRLPVEVGEQVHFNEVLLISDANNTMIGTPLVDNATVLATATKRGRGEKLVDQRRALAVLEAVHKNRQRAKAPGRQGLHDSVDRRGVPGLHERPVEHNRHGQRAPIGAYDG